ncbi:MAG: hypothetical protein Kow0090_19720 [Myxococcota bacterium]
MKIKYFLLIAGLFFIPFFFGALFGGACGGDDKPDVPGENRGSPDSGDDVTSLTCSYHSECGQAGMVCDIGAKICVQCLTTAHCSPGYICHQTRCETATECSSTGKCSNGVCNTATGFCVECLDNADCSATEICEQTTCLKVVECQSSAECEKGVCDAARSICVQCLEDVDCGEGGKCVGNYCEPFIKCSSDEECAESRMVCSAAVGACVVCLSDANCPDSHYCASDNRCAPDVCRQGETRCVGANVAICNANGSGETVAQCPGGSACADGACPGGMPIGDDDDGEPTCEPICSSRNCGQYGCCGDDGCGGTCGDCPEGTVCEKGYCLTIPENCTSNEMCTDPDKPKCSTKDGRCYPSSHCMIVGCGQMYCNPATGFCEAGKVEEWGTCVQDSDCKKGLKCYLTTHQCRQPCAGDAECGEGRYCETSIFFCDDTLCSSDGDCKDPKKPVCNIYTGKCEPFIPQCSKNEDCKAELTPLCNLETRKCVQCFTDADCTKENEVCNERGLCSYSYDAGGDDDDADAGDDDDDGGTVGPPCSVDDGTCDPKCPAGQICCEYICYTQSSTGDGGIVFDGGADAGSDGGGGGNCQTDADCPQGQSCLMGFCFGG